MQKANFVNQPASPDWLLTKAIREKTPIVLVLGQDAWSFRGAPDPILSLALSRLGRSEDVTRGWPALFGLESLPDDFYQWLSERFARRVQAGWLEDVARLPWSAVFTSSLDPNLRYAFESPRRDPQVILTGDEVPIAARSTARTPIYYLFGRAGVADTRAMPPRNRNELRARQSIHAIPILNRLPETATALGLIVVDGFTPGRDWLNLDPLLAAIEQSPPGQVIWCGWQGDDTSELGQEIGELVRRGQVVTTSFRLGTLIADLGALGRLGDLTTPSLEQAGVISFKGREQSFSPSPEIRIRVEAATSIVDDSWTAFQAPLGQDAEYAAFRRFHGDTEGPRMLVEGTRYGFAVTRDFENRLWQLVQSAVEDHARFDEPLIVHGQSGTGKSIALARIVAKVREAMRAAVLYSVARIPQSTDIDAFCEAAEHGGAVATVVICDCNAPVHRYRELLLSLRSRGRRVIVLGSGYRQVDLAANPPRTLVEAPDALSDTERDQLARLMGRFGGGPTPEKVGHDRNVLATLYRTLPVSRARLTVGLGREARAAEDTLRQRGEERVQRGPRSQLAEQLIAAGLATEDEQLLQDRIDDVLEAADDAAGQLIDLVMVPGRLNCHVPINLLLRAVTAHRVKIDLAVVARMFRGLDLFRWRRSDEEAEELFVSPRLTLEADLICRRRLIDARAEGLILVILIKAARLSWDAGGSERRFLLDLVQQLGPDGPLGSRYRESYLAAARALTELRNSYGMNDTSLMLQESALRRAAVREEVIPETARLAVLEEAREAVQTAIDKLGEQKGRVSPRARANLAVERASIYGFLATDRAQRRATSQEVWSAYEAARAAARAAVGMTTGYFPLDVSLWIPADLLQTADLPEERRMELQADIHSVLERIDPRSLPPEQRERFNKRRYSLGDLLRLPNLSEEAFAALDAEGSTAGYYLRARSIGPVIGHAAQDEVRPEDRKSAAEAAKFLRRNWQKIQADERCLRLLLQYEWIMATGRQLLRGERMPLPTDGEARRELLSLVRAVNTAAGVGSDNALRYLEAVFEWLIGDERHAQDIWRDLARETDFLDPRRVIRRHTLATEDGSPQVFSGRIESEPESGRFTVRVDNLNRRVQLLSRDFLGFELGYGQSVPRFGIAFNYIGPIADPISRRGGGA
jgi:hypothetical protein